MLKILRYAATILLLLALPALLIFSIFATVTDAQGMFVFFFTLPVMVFALVGCYLLTDSGSRLRLVTKIIALLIASFFVCAPIPKVNKIYPGILFAATTKIFTSITGKTPYAWSKERQNLEILLDKFLAGEPGPEIDFARFQPPRSWDTLCTFPPYTDNNAAKKLHRQEWDIELYAPGIATSDSISVVALLDGKGSSYIQAYPRGKLDFAGLGARCFPKAKAKFNLVITPDNRRTLRLK